MGSCVLPFRSTIDWVYERTKRVLYIKCNPCSLGSKALNTKEMRQFEVRGSLMRPRGLKLASLVQKNGTCIKGLF